MITVTLISIHSLKLELKIIGCFLFVSFLFPCLTGAKEKLPVHESLGGEFKMESTLGVPLSLSHFRGKLVLIYFGYTTCPDICPTTLTVIKQALQNLDDLKRKVQVLFISVDPERDTLERLKTYLKFFDPNFIGLRSEPKQLEKIAKQYGAFFKKDSNNESAVGYLVTHTGYTYLLDDQSRIRKLFSSKVESPEIVNTLQILLNS